MVKIFFFYLVVSHFELQAAYEQVQEAQEALYDFFNNIIESLIDEAPRRSQELCIKRKVRDLGKCKERMLKHFNLSDVYYSIAHYNLTNL